METLEIITTPETPFDFCKKHAACREGAEFAAPFQTLAAVWDACPRADWMLWMIQKADKTGGLDRQLRIFACDCADSAKPKDPRSIAAISTARRFADGLATLADLRAAYVAAYFVATYVADSAANAAAAYSAYSAANAAYVAAYVAAANAANAADSVAYARKTQADNLRALIPNQFANA